MDKIVFGLLPLLLALVLVLVITFQSDPLTEPDLNMALVYVNPYSNDYVIGDVFSVTIEIFNVSNLYGYSCLR